MDISIKWRCPEDGEWKNGIIERINHMTRRHALNLFSGKVAVIARQGDKYFTNKPELRDQYVKQGRDCKLFSELENSDKILADVGFI